MLDDAFQANTDAALTDLAQRPRAPKPQEPSINLWGLTRAPDRGLRAGVAEGIASTAEVLGAFGQVLATTPASAQGMFSTGTEAEKRERDEQARAIREEGVDFRSEAGRSFRNVARDFMPDPVTAHGAEVAVAEFARLGSKAVAAGLTMGPVAGAAVAGAEEGFTEAEKLAEKGVDLQTRTRVGAVTGLLTGLGFGIPVAGKTVAGTVGLAVAGGPASFISQQAATREILDSAGYDQLADQYDPFDPVGLGLSTLVPLGFGAMAMRSAARARADARPVDEAQVDAARVDLLRQHDEAGAPQDLAGMQAHRTAIAQAIDQMATGQRVDVSDVAPPGAERMADAHAARLNGLQSVAQDRPSGVPRDASLGRDDQRIEAALAAKVTDDFDAAVAEYNARPDAMGGKVLNTDVARELSPDYLADRTKSAAVHEPASYFVKRLYEQRLAEIQPGESVLFSSGGTGAGKTTGINNVPAARAMFEDAAIVYDTNMNKLESSIKKIEQALAAGADVQIMHVQRDPVEALVHGALPRAARQAQEFGTGRTVPLKAHAETHRGAAQVIQQLAEKYKDDPRVSISVIDNTRGKGGARLTDLGFVRGFDYTDVERKLYEALKQQYDAGAIPESVYRATAGDADPGAGPVLRSDVRGQPEPQRDGGSGPGRAGEEARTRDEVTGDGLPVESEALARAAGELELNSPDLLVQLDSMDAPVRLADLMARVRAEVAEDLAEAPLIETAANCFLRT